MSQRSQLFNFGFLNNAQDPTDIQPFEATICQSVDADQLALGRLASSDYFSEPLDVKDFDNAELNGRSFRLVPTGSGTIEYQEDSADSGSFVDLNRIPTADVPVPVVIGEDGVSITEISDQINMTIRRKTGLDYSGPESRIWVFTVTTGGSPAGSNVVGWRYGTDSPSNPSTRGSIPASSFGGFVDIGNNLEANIDAGEKTLGDITSVDIERPSLPDGSYTYLCVGVKTNNASFPTVLNPQDTIMSPPGGSASLTLSNIDEVGERTGNIVAEVTVPPYSDFPADLYTEVWLFRKDPDADDFIRVGVNTTAGDVVFIDTIKLSAIVNPVVFNGEKDENFQDINGAIGNAGQNYTKIFEKDGRMWGVPSGRSDLLLYSRAGAFAGWARNQSFAVDGIITDIEFIRDSTAIGGTITTVLFTTEKIYHITGNGTEVNPYELVEAVKNVNTLADSVVNANGIIMFTTVSTDAGYDTGHFGQKVYEYDLNRLIEVSAKFKLSDYVTSANASEFAVLRGGDKYFAKKTSEDRAIVYHRDAKGVVEIVEADETANDWVWQSKTFVTDFREFGKLGNARKWRIVLRGTVTLTFFVRNGDLVRSYVRNYATGSTRLDQMTLMPPVLGKDWWFKIEGSDGATVEEFYFVS